MTLTLQSPCHPLRHCETTAATALIIFYALHNAPGATLGDILGDGVSTNCCLVSLPEFIIGSYPEGRCHTVALVMIDWVLQCKAQNDATEVMSQSEVTSHPGFLKSEKLGKISSPQQLTTDLPATSPSQWGS